MAWFTRAATSDASAFAAASKRSSATSGFCWFIEATPRLFSRMASSVAVTRAGACRRAWTPLASDENTGATHEQLTIRGTACQSFYDGGLASMPERKFGPTCRACR